MNDLALLDAHGPAAASPDPAVLAAARARLLAETGRGPLVHSRFSRRTVLAGVAAAAAGVVLLSTTILTPETAPSTTVSLVAFTNPSFPLTLTAIPVGLAPPRYDYDPDRGTIGFRLPDVDEPVGDSPESFDSLRVDLTAAEPPNQGDPVPGNVGPVPEVLTRTVDIGGTAGAFTEIRLAPDELNDALTYTTLVYLRRPGQWVTVSGMGDFSVEALLHEVAASLVDRPVDVLPVELSVAPAGWALAEFRDSRTFFLRESGTERRMVVKWLPASDPALVDPAILALGEPVDSITEVQVNGERATLVDSSAGWLLQADLPDGSAFTLQLPRDLPVERVLTIAGGITRS